MNTPAPPSPWSQPYLDMGEFRIDEHGQACGNKINCITATDPDSNRFEFLGSKKVKSKPSLEKSKEDWKTIGSELIEFHYFEIILNKKVLTRLRYFLASSECGGYIFEKIIFKSAALVKRRRALSDLMMFPFLPFAENRIEPR